MKVRPASVIAPAIILVCYSAFGQSTDIGDFVEEVVVTATRRPIELRHVLPSTQIVNSADIERLQPRDLPSLLGHMSGLNYRDSGGRGSISGVFIRGATPAQSIVLIDGMRTSSATTGATALEAIPVSSIERIEIVKGPLSGMYGADAVGGVIQIFTKHGRKERPMSQIDVSYRTDDTQRYNAGLTASSERGSFHSTFSYENGQGIDSTTIQSGGNADRDGFNEASLNVAANYHLFETLEARLSVLRADSHNEFDNLFGDGTRFDSDNKIENTTFKLTYNPTEKLRLTADAGHFKDRHKIPAFSSDLTTRRTSISGQADYSLHSHHIVTFGIDYYSDRISALAAFSETSRDNLAGYLQWQGHYGPLTAVGSIRCDDNEAYGNTTNGSIATGYTLAENLTFSISYGTAFRAVSFNDLFFPNFGNPDLKPEESETFEISLRGNHSGLGWRINAYRTSVDNLNGFDPISFMAANVSEATMQGVEIELDYALGPWFTTGNLNYLDARDDTSGEYLDDRAEFAANFELYREIGPINVSTSLQSESGRHDRTGASIKGFVTMGLGANYQLNRHLGLSARIENLWNEDFSLNLATATDKFRTYGRTAIMNLSVEY